MTAINVHCTSNLCKFLFPQKKKTQAERVSTKVSTCYISIIVWVEWTHTYNSFFLLISSKRWYWIARHLPQCIPLLRWWRLNRLTWTMILDSLVIEKFLNAKMIIAGNYATMQLPIESLKNIQTFYLFIPQFQNMKFIYSSLQRKSCSRCCSYISIMWLFKTIFRHVCLWHRFLPQSTYRYPSLLKELLCTCIIAWAWGLPYALVKRSFTCLFSLLSSPFPPCRNAWYSG